MENIVIKIVESASNSCIFCCCFEYTYEVPVLKFIQLFVNKPSRVDTCCRHNNCPPVTFVLLVYSEHCVHCTLYNFLPPFIIFCRYSKVQNKKKFTEIFLPFRQYNLRTIHHCSIHNHLLKNEVNIIEK